jgi:hypothetical protein
MHRQRLFSALMQDAQDQNPGVEQYPLNDNYRQWRGQREPIGGSLLGPR